MRRPIPPGATSKKRCRTPPLMNTPFRKTAGAIVSAVLFFFMAKKSAREGCPRLRRIAGYIYETVISGTVTMFSR